MKRIGWIAGLAAAGAGVVTMGVILTRPKSSTWATMQPNAQGIFNVDAGTTFVASVAANDPGVKLFVTDMGNVTASGAGAAITPNALPAVGTDPYVAIAAKLGLSIQSDRYKTLRVWTLVT